LSVPPLIVSSPPLSVAMLVSCVIAPPVNVT